MKKKIMNIRPQEVTENGERSVQYKGSDGKMHLIGASNNANERLRYELQDDRLTVNGFSNFSEKLIEWDCEDSPAKLMYYNGSFWRELSIDEEAAILCDPQILEKMNISVLIETGTDRNGIKGTIVLRNFTIHIAADTGGQIYFETREQGKYFRFIRWVQPSDTSNQWTSIEIKSE